MNILLQEPTDRNNPSKGQQIGIFLLESQLLGICISNQEVMLGIFFLMTNR
jgi:hypothetical protein